MIPLATMIMVVQNYIFRVKGIRVSIQIRIGTEYESHDLLLLEQAFHFVTNGGIL